MGILDELLDAMLEAFVEELDPYGERAYEQAVNEERKRTVASIEEHLPALMELVSATDDHDGMYGVQRSDGSRVWLMELGELESYRLPGGSQWRMLYIGDDGGFYVYGPVDFDSRVDDSGWFERYSGTDGQPVELAMTPLVISDQTSNYLIALIRERVVSVFI